MIENSRQRGTMFVKQVVKHGYLLAIREQLLNQNGAYIPGASDNQYLLIRRQNLFDSFQTTQLASDLRASTARAGTPTAVAPGGTSRITTAPAPTVLSSPIEIP
jgi:hypothetical protein